MTPADPWKLLGIGIAILALVAMIALAVAGWRAWKGD